MSKDQKTRKKDRGKAKEARRDSIRHLGVCVVLSVLRELGEFLSNHVC